MRTDGRPRRVARNLILVLLLGLFPSAFAIAQQPWEGNAFSGNPRSILSAADALVKNGEESTVLLLEDRRIVLDSASRVLETRRLVYRIGTGDPGEWSNAEAVWRPWYQERPSIRAKVITPAGKLVELDRKSLVESPLGEGDTDTFGDTLILRAPLPSISAGSVVEIETVTKEIRPVFDRGISRYLTVGALIPVLKTRIVIEAPAALPVRHTTRLLPKLQPVRSTSGGKVITTFEVGSLDPIDPIDYFLDSADEPKIPYVAFSTSRDWSEVAAGYSKIVDTQIGQSNVAALVREVVGGASTREDIVDRILQRVQRGVRYKAVQLGDAAIVPTSPSETLRLEYGDCKDQAALIIAMLRAAGIDAQMALLSVSGFDADPDLPGFGIFDHAIVYVPGETPIWIDSTSGYSRVGQLPSQDQGRLALIARPGTSSLVRIPEMKSKTVETREVFLAELGAGRIVETTDYFGPAELAQRSLQSQSKAADLREDLQHYAQGVYAAKSVGNISRTEPADMSVPFQLKFEAEAAGVSETTLGEAVVVIGVSTLVEEIAFLAEDTGKQAETPSAPTSVRDTSREWRYRIVAPDGFRKNIIPESKSERWGPAGISWEFAAVDDRTVTGVFKFDTGKSRYSAEEVAEIKKGLSRLEEDPLLVVSFEQIGQSELGTGKVKEALAEFRRLSNLHPAEAIHHAQIAGALLAGGLGEAARKEARRATELDPKSVEAFQMLGVTLEHDLVGRRFQFGWDRDAAMAAHRRAIELDPDNMLSRINLAVLLEHNAEGQRYASVEDLDKAIDEYRTAIARASAEEKSVLQDNLSVALLWAGKFRDVRDTAVRAEIKLAATVVLDGTDAAVREANRLYVDAGQRQTVLVQVGSILMQIRQYEKAAELFRAGARGSTSASDTLARAEQAGRMKRYEEAALPATDPTTVVKVAIANILTGSPVEQIKPLMARSAQERLIRGEALLGNLTQAMRSLAGGATIAAVARDFFTSMVELTADGDDPLIRRVSLRMNGNASVMARFYVVREDGEYRLLALDRSRPPLAMEVLKRIDAGDTDGAKRILDWMRDESLPFNTDIDRLVSEALLRQWPPTPGTEPTPQSMRLAAASALSNTPEAAPVILPIFESAMATIKEGRNRDAIEMAYMTTLFTAGRYEESLRLAEASQAQNFSTANGRIIAYHSLIRLGRLQEAKEALKAKPPALPDGVSIEVRAIVGNAPDVDTSRRLAAVESLQGNFSVAESLLREVVSSRSATAGDYNNLAWLSLFRDKVTDEDVSTALRGASLGQSLDPSALHTLAALYAEVGRTAEAVQIIFQSISASGKREPSSSDWYVFGRIYEQLGEHEPALAAYARVQRPSGSVSPTSTYVLAQRRLDLSK